MLRFYSDQECTKQITKIEWSNMIIIPLVNGEKLPLPQTVHGGETATAIVWVRNESRDRYAVTEVSLGDKRIQYTIAESILIPNKPVKITLSFEVPKDSEKLELILPSYIVINGYRIVE